MPYTSIQYFFWLFSGVEISLLKQCPGDYNRQAGIGFTIFMTCLFASLAGGFAAFRFSEGNWYATIIFGIVWGLLIFSIDRSMVVTLKKDPNKVKQNFWEPFLTRLLLAGLLAFMISIPLEIEIFKGVINIQLKEDVQNAISKYGSNVEKTSGIAGVTSEQRRQEEIKNIAAANAVAANSSIPGWLSLNDEALNFSKSENNASQKADQARKEKERAKEKSLKKGYNPATNRTYYYYEKRGIHWQKYIAAIRDEKKYLKEANGWRIKKENKNKEAADLAREYREEQAKTAKVASLNAQKEADRKARLQTVIDSTKTDYEVSQKDLGFVRQYVAMENAAKSDSGVLFFLWVIRILFFTIEILPTIVKLKTPLGDYDRMLYHHETSFALSLQNNLEILRQKEKIRHNNELDIATQVEKDRLDQEVILNKQILTDIADRQQDLAKRILKDWHKQERLKLTKTPPKVNISSSNQNSPVPTAPNVPISSPSIIPASFTSQTIIPDKSLSNNTSVDSQLSYNKKDRIVSKTWQVQNSKYDEIYKFHDGSEEFMKVHRKVGAQEMEEGEWRCNPFDSSLISINLNGELTKYRITDITDHRFELVSTNGTKKLQLHVIS